jgi:diguanylate cyclase (GGDEF)-like protein
MKMTISRKLLLGYLAMALLTVLASVYAIISLRSLNNLTYAIINQDSLMLNKSKGMIDALLAQESAEKKYLILRDPSIAELFWTRSREFTSSLEALRVDQPPQMAAILKRISIDHDRYDELFHAEVSLVETNNLQEAMILSDRDSRQIIDTIAGALHSLERKAERSTDIRMNLIKTQGTEASRITMILSVVSLLSGFFLAILITYNISRPLRKLEQATGLVAEGIFDTDLDIRRQDEIGRLADAFRAMTDRLKVLEARNLDASPLTGLPGNMVIEEEIERRLKAGNPFALCHVDLDNFKPFADKYGYAWGSEVIKEVARILTDEITTSGAEGDFVGHIGGDDFVIISGPERAEAICKQIVSKFDGEILKFYSNKDKQRGFIVGKDRNGHSQKFPLITVTIAMVTDDGSRIESPLEMAKMAAKLKEYGKTLPGSNYVKQEDQPGMS